MNRPDPASAPTPLLGTIGPGECTLPAFHGDHRPCPTCGYATRNAGGDRIKCECFYRREREDY